jgi:hypothetical protein
VLAIAPTPTLGRQLSVSKIASALRRGGRQRRIDERAAEIQAALRAEVLEAPGLISEAMGASVRASVAVITELVAQTTQLESTLVDRFERHPDAKVIRSLPGLGMILGARVLGEFGDDPNRYADTKSRKNYAGTSPITRASGNTASCSPATPATSGWPTPPTSGRSVHSVPAQAPGPSMTNGEPSATPTTAPFDFSPTDSSASSTAVFATALSTTSTPPGDIESPLLLDRLGPWDV